jgi:hypothetical protein
LGLLRGVAFEGLGELREASCITGWERRLLHAVDYCPPTKLFGLGTR